jgi:hypothetical protein
MNSRQVRLLDHARLKLQLGGLIRRTRSGGKDSVDHKPGQHDDLANAAAGALVLAAVSFEIYGVFDFFQSLDSKTLLPTLPPASPTAAPISPDCPHPEKLVQQIGNGELRCGQCSAQWWPNGAPPQVTVYGRERDGSVVLRRK